MLFDVLSVFTQMNNMTRHAGNYFKENKSENRTKYATKASLVEKLDVYHFFFHFTKSIGV